MSLVDPAIYKRAFGFSVAFPGSLGLFPYRGIVPLWMVTDCVGSGMGRVI